MSDERIKDLPDIVPMDTTLVPGDSTGTGTGKATIRAWVLAGLAWALSQLANAAIAAQGVWTFANNVVLSQGLAVAGALTAAFGIDLGSHKATSMLDPTAAQDGATKNYVDTRVELYTPTYTFGGAGSKSQLGDVYAFRTGNRVHVEGVIAFTPGAGGVAETITITCPTTMTPANNFSNTSEQGGASLLGLHAATDYCTNITGVAGTKTFRFTCLTQAVTNLYWRFSYKIDN